MYTTQQLDHCCAVNCLRLISNTQECLPSAAAEEWYSPIRGWTTLSNSNYTSTFPSPTPLVFLLPDVASEATHIAPELASYTCSKTNICLQIVQIH